MVDANCKYPAYEYYKRYLDTLREMHKQNIKDLAINYLRCLLKNEPELRELKHLGLYEWLDEWNALLKPKLEDAYGNARFYSTHMASYYKNLQKYCSRCEKRDERKVSTSKDARQPRNPWKDYLNKDANTDEE